MREPYPLDGVYADCFLEPEMAIDRRHIYTIHEILSAWPFQRALEIGCWRGASSTAFIQAINRGATQRATLCDRLIQQQVRRVANTCHQKDKIVVVEMQSWDLLDTPVAFDFILVDGNHTIEAVTPELERLMKRKPACVMAHDTNATKAGYEQAEGAAMLAEAFRALPEYQTIEDCVDRPGEETKRGLFCATRGDALSVVARAAFRKYCE